MLALIALSLSPISLPDNGWIRFEKPAVAGTHRLGCMRDGEAALQDERNRWMSFSPNRRERDRVELEREFDQFDVFVEFDDGVVQQVRAFTPDCRVSGADDAQLVKLDSAAGVDLLNNVVDHDPERDVVSQVIATLAHIDDAAVDDVLEITANTIQHEDASNQALFWLAQRRGERGREIVAEHVDARWPLGHREHAAMSLALSEHPDAVEIVRDVARTAKEAELRAHAVTALGITNAPGAVADLHSIFLADTDREVRTQAIFGLAQQETPQAAETLVAIIRDPRHHEHRRDALFWLANMDGSAAQEAMDELMAEVL